MIRQELVRQVLTELRDRKDAVCIPSPDIDLVWVIAGPGTALTPQSTGLYKGRYMDLERIDTGIAAVIDITAQRLRKPPEQVTKIDIQQHGPVLLYNGENRDNGSYPHNEDFIAFATRPGFLLPLDNVIVQRLKRIYTPGQIDGLAEILRDHPEVRKIAVVTHAPHARRVGRYVSLAVEQGVLPTYAVFEELSVPERDVPVGATLGELKRILKYYPKGDLAANSAF